VKIKVGTTQAGATDQTFVAICVKLYKKSKQLSYLYTFEGFFTVAEVVI
jgi:hypothetical protein